MARMHVLRAIGNELHDAVIHAPVPEGTNAAGLTWSEAIVAAGLNVTALKVGKGKGQISEEEMAAIVAGTVIERHLQWGEDKGEHDALRGVSDPAARKAVTDDILSAYIDREIRDVIDDMQRQLRWFGFVVE